MDLSNREKKHLDILYPYLSECTLFLARDDSFPLNKPCSIVCYGYGVRHTVKGGTGSGDVNARFFTSIEEGLEKANFVIANKEQLDLIDIQHNEQRKDWVKRIKKEAKRAHMLAPIYAIGKAMPEAEYNIPLVETAEAAIYVVSRVSGEGSDREIEKGDILLTDYEINTINELDKKYKKFMVVINAGGMVDLSPIQGVRNILVLSELGSLIGSVLPDILLGKMNPSGKLAATWANIDDYPYEKEIPLEDTYYNEGIFVGYRFFDTYNVKPLYCFGYGLSYTDFKLDNINVSQKGNLFNIRCDVTNIGNYKGKEVVQVYVSPLIGNINTPYQELVGFKKSKEISPKNKDTINIEFSLKYIAKFDKDRCVYYLAKGDYIVRVGNASNNTIPVASINIKEDIIIKKCIKIYPDINNKELFHINEFEKPSKLQEFSLKQADFEIFEGKEEEIIVPDVIKGMTNNELALINNGLVGKQTSISFVGETSISAPGAAGESSYVFTHYFNKKIVMADGPAGIRLTPRYYKKKGKVKKLEYNAFLIAAIEFFPRPLKWLFSKIFNNNKLSGKNEEIFYQYCTALPISTAIAQSFNIDLASVCGDIVGKEMEEYDIDLWLAPAMNIQRTIMCGRNFEYFSEDPFLSGTMASYLTNAVQSHNGKGVTVKHFAANNQETRRTTSNSVMNESTLREIYLRGFEIVFDNAHPKAVMSSYNLINGVHTSEDYHLIHDYLFVENAYEGVIMTDWVFRGGQVKNTKYPITDSPLTYKTHTSLFMPGSKYHIKQIEKDVDLHPENREILEKNASRLYKNFVKQSKSGNVINMNEEKVESTSQETTIIEKPIKEKKSKRVKLKYRTKENDIKYRGPLSYRHLRIIAWVLMAIAQLSWIFALAAHINSDFAPTYSRFVTLFDFLATLPLPLFIIANFGIILRRRNDFRWLLTFYGGVMAILYVIGNIVVIHYVWGTLRTIMPGYSFWDALVSSGSLLASLGQKGYLFNIFVDLFLCVLTVFFLFYKPKKHFQGKNIKWFRLMVFIPLLYEIASLVIKQLGLMELMQVPSFLFFLLTSKPPLTFLAFFIITIVLKVREVRFLKKFNGDETKLEEHYSTNAHSLRVSITISVAFAIAAIVDALALGGYVVIDVVRNLPDVTTEDDMLFLVFNGVARATAIGFGGSTSLIFVIPFVLLYSYKRTHANTKIDSFIPLIGIGLVIFTIIEGLFITLRMSIGELFNAIMNGGEDLFPEDIPTDLPEDIPEGEETTSVVDNAIHAIKHIIRRY